jgi:hypothetical protein
MAWCIMAELGYVQGCGLSPVTVGEGVSGVIRLCCRYGSQDGSVSVDNKAF